jgi:hypothetical protein
MKRQLWQIVTWTICGAIGLSAVDASTGNQLGEMVTQNGNIKTEVNFYPKSLIISSDDGQGENYVSPPSPLLIFYGGFRDENTQIVKNLKEKIEKIYTQSPKMKYLVVEYYPWDKYTESINYIQNHLKNYPNSPIVLVGHSYGGDTAYVVARSLGAKVQLLVTLDPVGKSGIDNKKDCSSEYPSSSNRRTQSQIECEQAKKQRSKPSNVVNWVNIWVTGAGTGSDVIAQVGEPWNKQQNADQDIPLANVPHSEAPKMYIEVNDRVFRTLETISSDSSEPKLGCQATVDKVLQEIRSKGVRRAYIDLSKGTANEGRTGNPTNRTDELSIGLSSFNETYTNRDPKSDNIINDIMNSEVLMKSWADRIVVNCSNTAIVSFGAVQSDGVVYYYIQSDGKTKLMNCLNTNTPPSILRWGEEWGPHC